MVVTNRFIKSPEYFVFCVSYMNICPICYFFRIPNSSVSKSYIFNKIFSGRMVIIIRFLNKNRTGITIINNEQFIINSFNLHFIRRYSSPKYDAVISISPIILVIRNGIYPISDIKIKAIFSCIT